MPVRLSSSCGLLLLSRENDEPSLKGPEGQVLILEFLGNVISILAAWEYQMKMKTIAFNSVIFCFECFYLTSKAAIMLQ